MLIVGFTGGDTHAVENWPKDYPPWNTWNFVWICWRWWKIMEVRILSFVTFVSPSHLTLESNLWLWLTLSPHHLTIFESNPWFRQTVVDIIVVFDGSGLPVKGNKCRERGALREFNRAKAQELVDQGKDDEAQKHFQRSVVVTSEMVQQVLFLFIFLFP